MYGGGIFTSTNGGVTWTNTSAPNGATWYSIASSADGTRLVAADLGGSMHISADGGVTWTNSGPAYGWASVASSADGTYLAAVVFQGPIFTSTDGGATWMQTSATGGPWSSIASSADGLYLAAVTGGSGAVAGGIYTSTNGGSTWTTNGPAEIWQSIAVSADGLRMAAVVPGGGIYNSTSGGATWMQGNAPSGSWSGIASSADGTRLAAVLRGGGGIYTSVGTASPLAPGTTYHYRAVGESSAGTGFGNDLTFTTIAPATNFTLTGAVVLPGGAFQFSFTNVAGLGFTVLATTNLALPLSNWTVLGAPVEGPSGQYQFTDTQATNTAIRFYRVSSP